MLCTAPLGKKNVNISINQSTPWRIEITSHKITNIITDHAGGPQGPGCPDIALAAPTLMKIVRICARKYSCRIISTWMTPEVAFLGPTSPA
jgi:hypothetical protein